MSLIILVFIAIFCNVYMFKHSEDYIIYFFWSVCVVIGYAIAYFFI